MRYQYIFLTYKYTIVHEPLRKKVLKKTRKILASVDSPKTHEVQDVPTFSSVFDIEQKFKSFVSRLDVELTTHNSLFEKLSISPGKRINSFFTVKSDSVLYVGCKTDFKRFVNWLYTKYFLLGSFEDLKSNKNRIYLLFAQRIRLEFWPGTPESLIRDSSFKELSCRLNEKFIRKISKWKL